MSPENDFLKVLTDYFTEYIDDNFDISLSRQYMKFLTPLISHYSVDEFNEQINDFVRLHEANWLGAARRLRLIDREYLIQPELLLMLYLLDKDPYVLIDVLDGEIPLSDVDEIFMCWGLTADDYRP